MAAILTPSSQLGFNRPLTRSITKVLTVTNPHGFPIAFKVKTTAPKLYVVRPNSGSVQPGESVEVAVILQAMKDDPPAGSKCKDKFLIQTTSLGGEREHMQSADLWNPTDDDPASIVHQQKIRVAYLPPEGETIPEDLAEQPSIVSDADASRYQTIREQPANGHAHPSAGEALSPPSPSPLPPQRIGSPGDFIVAQEETTTTHILHDIDEPVAAPAPVVQRAPTPPSNVAAPVQPNPAASLLAAGAGIPPPQPVQTPAHYADEPEPVPEPPAPVVVVAQPAHQPAPAVVAPAPVIEPVVSAPAPAPRAPTPRAEPTVNAEHEALMQRYADALAEIARLQAELSASAAAQQPVGVRRRTTTRVVSEDGETLGGDGDYSDAEGTAVDTLTNNGGEKGLQVEGVPINIVAGIAFAVFLATYLFF